MVITAALSSMIRTRMAARSVSARYACRSALPWSASGAPAVIRDEKLAFDFLRHRGNNAFIRLSHSMPASGQMPASEA